ncbi:MAG: dipeptide epimerase [Candidatus Eremiobacteraeota bacterium]|nr:dipeptide epimerase [Candidatus Eremiobacteraeota bacterium]
MVRSLNPVPVQLDLSELSLPLLHTFTIARSSHADSRSLIGRLRWNGLEGLGECVPSSRYAESVDSVRAYLEAHPLRGDDPYALETLLDDLPPGARCLLDVALHDLIGKDVQRPLWQLLGLDPTRTPTTSFTIGIDTPDVMLAKLDEIRDHPIIKVKLGFPEDVAVLEAIRARYTGTLRIDANEGWTPEQSVANLAQLATLDVEFCEQPIPAGTPERLRWIRERSNVPLVTDEDSRDAGDLPALAGCVDGINVKLVKCGGIRGALAMIHTARALGLRVMLGCMVESAILTTAAAQLSPLVDWADLDGPFLTARDPFSGVAYEHGKLVLPMGPGLGVTERAETAAA